MLPVLVIGPWLRLLPLEDWLPDLNGPPANAIHVKMERAEALDLYGRPLRLRMPWWVWNLFGEQGVFLLTRGGGK